MFTQNTMLAQRVLVVDDSTQITSLLTEVFAACGADVICANSGKSAILTIDAARPAILVLDLLMPHMGGLEVLMHVRRTQPGLLERTIILTGQQHHRDHLEELGFGSLVVMPKPFDIDELRQAACGLLHGMSTRPAA